MNNKTAAYKWAASSKSNVYLIRTDPSIFLFEAMKQRTDLLFKKEKKKKIYLWLAQYLTAIYNTAKNRLMKCIHLVLGLKQARNIVMCITILMTV